MQNPTAQRRISSLAANTAFITAFLLSGNLAAQPKARTFDETRQRFAELTKTAPQPLPGGWTFYVSDKVMPSRGQGAAWNVMIRNIGKGRLEVEHYSTHHEDSYVAKQTGSNAYECFFEWGRGRRSGDRTGGHMIDGFHELLQFRDRGNTLVSVYSHAHGSFEVTYKRINKPDPIVGYYFLSWGQMEQLYKVVPLAHESFVLKLPNDGGRSSILWAGETPNLYDNIQNGSVAERGKRGLLMKNPYVALSYLRVGDL